MAKLCRHCLRHQLLDDPGAEGYAIDYCPAHGIVIDPSRLDSPACARARFDAAPAAAAARPKARPHAPKRPRARRS